jgi:hypothetical protein
MDAQISLDGKQYDMEYSVEEAQDGGMVDPSWDAFIEVDSIKLNGEFLGFSEVDNAVAVILTHKLEQSLKD